MRIRFQADANLDPDIVRGLYRREPAIDFALTQGVIRDALPDSEVLRLAADAGRVLVSRDVRTMPKHFNAFVASHQSPGLILVPAGITIGAAIDGLLFAWLAWTAEEMENHLRWLPR